MIQGVKCYNHVPVLAYFPGERYPVHNIIIRLTFFAIITLPPSSASDSVHHTDDAFNIAQYIKPASNLGLLIKFVNLVTVRLSWQSHLML
jgi:hypothetical protein